MAKKREKIMSYYHCYTAKVIFMLQTSTSLNLDEFLRKQDLINKYFLNQVNIF